MGGEAGCCNNGVCPGGKSVLGRQGRYKPPRLSEIGKEMKREKRNRTFGRAMAIIYVPTSTGIAASIWILRNHRPLHLPPLLFPLPVLLLLLLLLLIHQRTMPTALDGRYFSWPYGGDGDVRDGREPHGQCLAHDGGGWEGTGELTRTVPYQSLAVFMQLQFESRSTGSRPVQCRSPRGMWTNGLTKRFAGFVTPHRDARGSAGLARLASRTLRATKEGWGRRRRRVCVFSRHPHLRTSHLSRSEKQQAVGWLTGRMAVWLAAARGVSCQGGRNSWMGFGNWNGSRFPVNWSRSARLHSRRISYLTNAFSAVLAPHSHFGSKAIQCQPDIWSSVLGT